MDDPITAPPAEPTPPPAPTAFDLEVDKGVKSADALVEEIANHVKHFVNVNLPQLERQGVDFAGTLRIKFGTWLVEAEKHLTGVKSTTTNPTT